MRQGARMQRRNAPRRSSISPPSIVLFICPGSPRGRAGQSAAPCDSSRRQVIARLEEAVAAPFSQNNAIDEVRENAPSGIPLPRR
jgi:hypothetical protein